jgi:hypothetical protein
MSQIYPKGSSPALCFIFYLKQAGMDKVVLWTVGLFFTVCGLEEDLLLPIG